MNKCNVLIVEDDPLSAQILSELCESIGFVICHTINNSHDAINLIAKCDIDLILLDIDLETENAGIHVAKIAKEKYNIPVVFVTGKTDDNSIHLASQTGAYCYLVKPINQKSFLANAKFALNKAAEMRLREDNRKKLLSLYHNTNECKTAIDLLHLQLCDSKEH